MVFIDQIPIQNRYAARPMLNQLYTPAEPTPACAERHSINARVTAKPTLATVSQR